MLIGRVFARFRRWKKKRDTWKKYRNLTRYHFDGDQYDIGDFTHGVPSVYSYDSETRLVIGKYCSIAAGVRIVLGGNHHVKWVSTYGFYQETESFPDWCKINDNYVLRGNVNIGNDVWIGRDALILSGSVIGDGAVVGAGAVVAGKVPPYSIVVGNPAKVIRYRFDDSQIEDLLKIRWWDWPVEKINRYLPYICSENIDRFISESKKIMKGDA